MVEPGVATLPGSGRMMRYCRSHGPASSFAHRISEASAPPATGVRFYRWVKLEQSSTRIVEHHPRALY
jgi:hypothetical protein